MVDWKKDMKLSDLLARGKGDGAEPEETGTPFWKREIRFGRRKAETEWDFEVETSEDESEERPFFARSLSFGRTTDDAPSDTGFDRPVDESEETTPFWKRELSFSRRSDDATDASVEHEFEQDEPEPAAEDLFEDRPEKTPFWKHRKGEASTEVFDWDDSEPAAEDVFEGDEVENKPFWKREVAFGRREDDATPDDFEEPHEETHVEADETKALWKRELRFGRRKEDASPETGTSLELENVEHEDPEPVAAAAADPEQAAETPVEPEPVASFAESAPPEEAPFTDEPGFASAGAQDSAEALDDSADDEAPFWKREIKVGRRRGDADLVQPVGVPQPPSDEDDVFAEAAADSHTGGTRFWKRELKLGRAKEERSDADFEAPGDQEKKPFFKLSLRRSKDPDFDAPKPEKRPFYKRELSFRREKTGGRSSSARAGGNKQLVGLKVGASQIAAARIVNNGSPQLVQLARQSIEQGIVVGGELRDPDALAEALREFFTKYKLPNRNVRLGIGNNRIGVRSFEISGVHDPKQLENAIRFRAQEALPIPLDEAVLDYQVIDESASPTGIRTYRVLLVVAYRELIDRYVAACRGAGLRLVGIDLEAFALLRALSPPPGEGLPEDTALVAVSIGHDRSTFAVSNGTVCEFTRVLDWGGSSLNTSIARALDITPSQAEPVKRTLSLNEGEEGAPTQSNEHTNRAEEAVRLELRPFARELVSSLHFYQNQPGSLAIGSITLTGGTAHLPGLAAELQRLIGVKVRVGDPLRRVKTAKRVETPAQVGSMAVAIGLGIED
jgi:type IV pilus assembly protein PilM